MLLAVLVGLFAPPFWLVVISIVWGILCCVLAPERASCFVLTWLITMFLYSHGYLFYITGCVPG